jgi:hypothetical protein
MYFCIMKVIFVLNVESLRLFCATRYPWEPLPSADDPNQLQYQSSLRTRSAPQTGGRGTATGSGQNAANTPLRFASARLQEYFASNEWRYGPIRRFANRALGKLGFGNPASN